MRISISPEKSSNPNAGVGVSNIYKEYLDEREAAEYMCLSKSAFNEHKSELGILPHRLPGIAKNVYKRSELQSIMEEKLTPWQQSIQETADGISNGQRASVNAALASLKNLESKRKRRQRHTGSQKNSKQEPAQQ